MLVCHLLHDTVPERDVGERRVGDLSRSGPSPDACVVRVIRDVQCDPGCSQMLGVLPDDCHSSASFDVDSLVRGALLTLTSVRGLIQDNGTTLQTYVSIP